jgi:hypothetical protein
MPDGNNSLYCFNFLTQRDLEMGYNPNNCVEVRWGAPAESEETSTCKAHAPQAQRAKMMEYRNWFRERHWPHT